MHFKRRCTPVLVIVFSLFAFNFSGCKPDLAKASNKGLVLSSNLQFKSYVHSVVVANGSKETNFYFPLLQVYDREGRLVYVGHNAQANSALLEQIPGSINDLRPIQDTTLLPQIMSQMPEFKGGEADFLRTQRVTVLSVSLEDCHACSVQEKALDSNQKQLLDRGVNLLILRVTRPI